MPELTALRRGVGKQVLRQGTANMLTASCANAAALLLILTGPVLSQENPLITTEEAKLTASDAGAADHFGIAVGVSGDTAVVGSRDDDNAGGVDAGSAYVYVRRGSSWTEQAKLTASDATAQDNLGASVAVSGDVVVVGTYVESHDGADQAGAVYVFVRTGATWTEQAKLTASDSDSNDWFGQVVAIEGDTLVVGSPFDDNDGGTNAGAAYIYARIGTSWIEEAKLTASDAVDGDAFGSQVAISGDVVVVAAPFDDDAGAFSGSAYVFARSGTSWAEQAKLTSSDAAAHDAFGYGAAVSGERVVVGVYGDDNAAGIDAGAMYVFGRTGTVWSEEAKVTASDSAAGDFMGAGIALSDDTAVVGALQYMAGGFDAGAAYVFRLDSAGAWTDLGLGLAGSSGTPVLVGTGTLLPGSPITLSLSNAKPLSFAALVVGLSAIQAPFKGGIMVPNLDIDLPGTTDGFGSSVFGGPWPAGVPSGFTIFFQWWIKDAAGPAGFAASNALSATAP